MSVSTTPEPGQTSTTNALPPLVTALQKADDFLGPNRVWSTAEGRRAERQQRFLEVYESTKQTMANLDCVSAIADRSITVINEWLARHGFTVQLCKDPGPDGFATASILDILVNWQVTGTVDQILHNGEAYPAFTIKHGVRVLRTPYPNPVVYLQTKEGYNVFLAVADREPGYGFDLLDAILSIRKVNRSQEYYSCDGVTIPMVNLDETLELSWLCGLRTVGDDESLAFVSEAVGQNKFRMNQLGARAQSGVAMSLIRGIAQVYIIDQPFYLWIDTVMEDEIPPLFAAYLAPDVWSDPGDLSKP